MKLQLGPGTSRIHAQSHRTASTVGKASRSRSGSPQSRVSGRHYRRSLKSSSVLLQLRSCRTTLQCQRLVFPGLPSKMRILAVVRRSKSCRHRGADLRCGLLQNMHSMSSSRPSSRSTSRVTGRIQLQKVCLLRSESMPILPPTRISRRLENPTPQDCMRYS